VSIKNVNTCIQSQITSHYIDDYGDILEANIAQSGIMI